MQAGVLGPGVFWAWKSGVLCGLGTHPANGELVGLDDGADVGAADGAFEGELVGLDDGAAVGADVGVADGLGVLIGAAVGAGVTTSGSLGAVVGSLGLLHFDFDALELCGPLLPLELCGPFVLFPVKALGAKLRLFVTRIRFIGTCCFTSISLFIPLNNSKRLDDVAAGALLLFVFDPGDEEEDDLLLFVLGSGHSSMA